jgi:type III secretion system FlhB-like substrate exporter
MIEDIFLARISVKNSEIIDNATAAVIRIKIKKGLEKMLAKISNSLSIPTKIYLFLLKLFYQLEVDTLDEGNTPI